jgi:uncharacterized protein (DUF1697 family)
MTSYVALPRAINAGVTLPMKDLKAIGEGCGFERCRTYIASGNLLFHSDLSDAQVKAKLEAALEARVGKPVLAIVRSAAELAAAVEADPYPEAPRNRVICLFLDTAPAAGFEAGAKNQGPDEDFVAVGREVFVRYGEGMGQSKLAFPEMKRGTGRNLNTLAKLAQMAAE